MTCEDCQRMLSQPLQTFTAAEVTSAVLHARKCDTCRRVVHARMPKKIANMTSDELAEGLRRTGGSETLKRIVNDEECLGQIAEHLKVEPERIKFVAQKLFGTDIASGQIGETRGRSQSNDEFEWNVAEDSIKQLAEACLDVVGLAYMAVEPPGNFEASVERSSKRAVAFVRPLFQKIGAKFDSEKRDGSLENMKAFALEALAAVAEHITKILKGEQ